MKTEPNIDKNPLVGQALIKEGIITEEQLSRAVKVQSLLEQPKQLGEILIELGYATKQAITEAISKHGRGMRVGEMLVAQGLISPYDLGMALALQKETKKAIGVILVEQGLINEHTLLQNLAHQNHVPYMDPSFALIDPSVLAGVSPEYMERHSFVPFSRSEDGFVTIIVSDLRSGAATGAIEELYREKYRLALGPTDSIRKTIEDYRKFRAQKPSDSPREPVADETSVIHVVEHIFAQAIDQRASDIHIEPMADRIRLRYRIDGELVFKSDLPLDMLPKIISRLKILADCNITEHQRHQGGRIEFAHQGKPMDLRASFYVTVHGECAVMRVLNKQVGLVGLDELGMASLMLERYRNEVLDPPTGVVLVTGPTGSGKTTTLYSSVDYCNEIGTKIITAEDPVEYVIDGLIQCSIYDKAGRTFETSLREIVRQDPDIIVLGEIRDKLTAETAIQAALTGHKVYSTFHTEDSIGALVRLMNMDIEPFLVASTVIAVVGQRLLRKICPHCATPYTPPPRDVRNLDLDPSQVRPYDFKMGRGCKDCNFTGYRGRIGAYELLIINEGIKEAILDRKPSHEIRKIAIDTAGLVSMREDAISKAIRGQTTFAEVLKNTPRTFSVRNLQRVLSLTS